MDNRAESDGVCPHCGSADLDRGGTGLDLCRDCGGFSRAGKFLHRPFQDYYGMVTTGKGGHPSGQSFKDDRYCVVLADDLVAVLEVVEKLVRLRDYPPGLAESTVRLRESLGTTS